MTPRRLCALKQAALFVDVLNTYNGGMTDSPGTAPRKFSWMRVFRLGTFALLMGLVMLLAAPVYGAWRYIKAEFNPGCAGTHATLDGYPSEAVEFPSRDGPVLRGFFIHGSTHADTTIIVLNGY